MISLRLSELQNQIPPTIGPESIGIALTNACNLNCVTCWTYSHLRRERPALEWMRRRLSPPLLKSLFHEAKTLRTERVIFTGGGDPLAHPDVYEVLTDAKAAGLKVTLISNLTLARDPDRLSKIGVTTLLANFSCGDADSYVAFHPNRSAEDFPRLVARLKQMASGGTQIKLVFVICAVNVAVLPKVVEIAADIGAAIQFKVMSATEDTRSIALTEDMRRQLLAEMNSLLARAATLNVPLNADTLLAELSGTSPTQFPIEETGCFAGHYYARITANADVYYCCNQHPTLRIGSLHDNSFTTLWQSERWQSVRQQLAAGKFVSGCEQCGKFDLNRKVLRQLNQLKCAHST